MSNKRITELNEVVTPASSDVLAIVNDSETKKITFANLQGAIDHGLLTGLADDDHAQYHNDARALTWLGTRSTTDLPEGTNLYYTDARADARIGLASISDLAVKDHDLLDGLLDDDHTQYHNDSRALTWLGTRSTTDLSEGTNLYYTQVRFDTAFGLKTTTDLAEGTNLYFTTERSQDITGGMVSGNVETLISVTYDDINGKLDFVVDEASIDHGSIAGLGDDDHTQYILADGSRALAGNWDLGGFNLTNGGTIAGTTITGANVTSGADPGHTHTGASLSGIDISDDTNLAVTSPIVLTDDTLSHSSANGFVHIPIDGSGTQILQYSSAGTAKWITLSADVSIADGGAVTVADDSHNHTGTTLSGIDISLDTNLAVTNPIVLTDDTLSHASTDGFVHTPAGGSATQILQYSSAGTSKWVTVSSDITIADGGAMTVADDSHDHTSTTLPDVETLTTSLTAGSVVFSDGTNLAQDNANFFWDDSNNRLGLGTAVPDDCLHILEATTASIHVENTGDAQAILALDSDRGAANNSIGAVQGKWDGNVIGQVQFTAGTDTTNKDDGFVRIFNYQGGASQEVARFGGPSDRDIVFNEGSFDTNFRVESNGNANMLFVDAGNNRVGIGTGSPLSSFHVESATSSSMNLVNTGNNSVDMILNADRTTAGNLAATIAGKWDGNFIGRIIFTCGSDTTNKDEGFFKFETWQGGVVGEVARFGGQANRHVIFNVPNNDADFTVETSGSGKTFHVNGGTNRVGILNNSPGSSLHVTGTILASNLGGGAVNLTCNGSGQIIRDPSDERLKEEITNLTGGLEKIRQLQGRIYKWKEEADMGTDIEYGLIAQEVGRVDRKLINISTVTESTEDELGVKDNMYSINLRSLIATTIEAIKELADENDILKQRIIDLETA